MHNWHRFILRCKLKCKPRSIMSTVINVVCYKSKTLANGENPLMICICKEGKRKYKSLGISVNKKYWDFNKNRPKLNCPNKDEIETIITQKKLELREIALSLTVENREFTATSLLTEQASKFHALSVKEYLDHILEAMLVSDKIGNYRFYSRLRGSLRAFTNNRLDIPFCSIDQGWLKRYEKWLVGKHNKGTTVSIMFRTLRSLYNKAIVDKCARRSDYPFDEFKISKFDTRTTKRALSKSDIWKIYNTQTSKSKSEYFDLSKDIFLFSYLCGGINFVDIANLEEENIADGRLHYIRQKTGRMIKIGLPSKALHIINKYKGTSKGYLFPIFDKDVHKTLLQKQYRIHKTIDKVNRCLKDIGSQLELKIPLTTYVARHSFATVLKKSGVDISMISEMLGHADLSTTQIYLDGFDDEQIDNAMSKLL